MSDHGYPSWPFDYGAAATRGARAQQQDVLTAIRTRDELIVALADGVGGRPGGADAAKTATDTALAVLSERNDGECRLNSLRRATGEADRAVGALARDVEASPACTLVLAVFSQNSMAYVSVGDSHLVCFRNGELQILTDQQNRRNEFEEAALLMGDRSSWQRVAQSGNRALTSAITGEGRFDTHVHERDLHPDDIYLVASDGVESVSFYSLRRAVPVLVGRNLTAQSIAERIVTGIDDLAHPSQDNTAIGIISCAREAHSEPIAATDIPTNVYGEQL